MEETNEVIISANEYADLKGCEQVIDTIKSYLIREDNIQKIAIESMVNNAHTTSSREWESCLKKKKE